MKTLNTLLILLLPLSIFCQRDPSLGLKPPTEREIKNRMIALRVGNYDSLIGKQFGDFEEKDISGKNISSKDLLGKVTLVNFWFSTCAPCNDEFKKINAIYSHYKSDTNFQVISFTFDGINDIKTTSQKYSLLYKIIPTSNEICHKLLVMHGFPSNFIIDQTGIITLGHTGAGEPGKNSDPFTEVIMPKIDSLLSKLKIQAD